jgi:ABC-type sugar transport system ATPase subunit
MPPRPQRRRSPSSSPRSISWARWVCSSSSAAVASLREPGIISIFTSHNLHHVYPIADRIVAIARGEKIADLRMADTSIDELADLIV